MAIVINDTVLRTWIAKVNLYSSQYRNRTCNLGDRWHLGSLAIVLQLGIIMLQVPETNECRMSNVNYTANTCELQAAALLSHPASPAAHGAPLLPGACHGHTSSTPLGEGPSGCTWLGPPCQFSKDNV